MSSVWYGYVAGAMVVNTFNSVVVDYEFLSVFDSNVPFFCSVLSVLLCVFFSTRFSYFFYFVKRSFLGRCVYLFFNRKWYFDLVFNFFVLNSFLYFGYYISYKLVDGFFQYVGPFGSTIYSKKVHDAVSSVQDGNLTTYATWIMWSLVFFMLLFLVSFFV